MRADLALFSTQTEKSLTFSLSSRCRQLPADRRGEARGASTDDDHVVSIDSRSLLGGFSLRDCFTEAREGSENTERANRCGWASCQNAASKQQHFLSQ
jgi:hypothetical protein